MVEVSTAEVIADSRNVVNRYKGWMQDLIKQDLSNRALPYSVLMEAWNGDFNIGTLVRNANAFAAQEVLYIGKRKWDRRSSVGTYHYTNVIHLPSFNALSSKKTAYHFIGIDNVPGAIDLADIDWPDNSLMLFGEEGTGLTKEALNLCERIVQIPMFGSVRSLNCGTASGIVMNDYVQKRQRKCEHVFDTTTDTCSHCLVSA
jgi:tRNA G18 (ribose-2'-O)-methylase SpoU